VNAHTTNHNDRGAWAEDMALAYLLKHGLREISRNYRCRYGEIDLILEDGDTLIFAEVRYRAKGALVSAQESVGYPKQRRLLASAEHYLQRTGETDNRECRFDVLALSGAISGNEKQLEVQWIRDAFQA
jgi:putative endonuclease